MIRNVIAGVSATALLGFAGCGNSTDTRESEGASGASSSADDAQRSEGGGGTGGAASVTAPSAGMPSVGSLCGEALSESFLSRMAGRYKVVKYETSGGAKRCSDLVEGEPKHKWIELLRREQAPDVLDIVACQTEDYCTNTIAFYHWVMFEHGTEEQAVVQIATGLWVLGECNVIGERWELRQMGDRVRLEYRKLNGPVEFGELECDSLDCEPLVETAECTEREVFELEPI